MAANLPSTKASVLAFREPGNRRDFKPFLLKLRTVVPRVEYISHVVVRYTYTGLVQYRKQTHLGREQGQLSQRFFYNTEASSHNSVVVVIVGDVEEPNLFIVHSDGSEGASGGCYKTQEGNGSPSPFYACVDVGHISDILGHMGSSTTSREGTASRRTRRFKSAVYQERILSYWCLHVWYELLNTLCHPIGRRL